MGLTLIPILMCHHVPLQRPWHQTYGVLLLGITQDSKEDSLATLMDVGRGQPLQRLCPQICGILRLFLFVLVTLATIFVTRGPISRIIPAMMSQHLLQIPTYQPAPGNVQEMGSA